MHKRGNSSGLIGKFEKIVISLSGALNWVAGAALTAALALTLIDIISTKVFSAPLSGGIEIVGLLCVIIVAFAIAYTQILHGHIEVEMFVKRLSKRWQFAISTIVSFFSTILFGVLTWRSYDYGRVLQASGEVSMTQHIPLYPFVYAISFCSVFVWLVVIAQWLTSLRRS
jgi:TRAP-type C4-dicarboxylate transport system permease small subunit